MTIIVSVVMLLLAAAASAIIFRRLRFPYTIGLVLVGIVIGALISHFRVLSPLESARVTPNIILYILLPTLIFNAAVNIDTRLLIKCLAPVLTLAAPGLIIAMLLTGALIAFFTPLAIAPALLFGALISATDPVAVIALFEELGAPKRLTMLVDGESLFNDATAIMSFQIMLGLTAAGAWGLSVVAEAGIKFVTVFCGGLLIGAIIGYLMVLAISLARNDPLVEIAFTTVVAYASFIIANYYLDVSGVMAVVGAGVVINWYGSVKFTPEVREYMKQFWNYATFVANSFVFLLVGLTERFLFEQIRQYEKLLLHVAIAIGVVLLVRAVVVFGLTPLVNRFPHMKRIGRRTQAVMFWGGLRGALPIGLAISLPQDFPGRFLIIQLTLGVVLFTLLVQGTTMSWLISLLGLDRPSLAERFAEIQARLSAKEHGLKILDEVAGTWHIPAGIVDPVRAEYAQKVEEGENELRAFTRDTAPDAASAEHILWTQTIALAHRAYHNLCDEGFLSVPVVRELDHSVELLRDAVHDRDIPQRVIPGTPPGARFSRMALRILHPVLRGTSTSFLQRHRARILIIEHERDLALAEGAREVLAVLPHLAELCGAAPESSKRCRAFFTLQEDEARHRLDAVRKKFPKFMGHVIEETIHTAALNGEEAVIEEFSRNRAVSARTAEALEELIEARVRHMRKLEWSEVDRLDKSR